MFSPASAADTAHGPVIQVAPTAVPTAPLVPQESTAPLFHNATGASAISSVQLPALHVLRPIRPGELMADFVTRLNDYFRQIPMADEERIRTFDRFLAPNRALSGRFHMLMTPQLPFPRPPPAFRPHRPAE